MTLFKNDDDSVPSVKAVADYVDSNISGAMSYTVGSEGLTLSVQNATNGLCAVRITEMSSGDTLYQSNLSYGTLTNKTTAFTFTIVSGANYMVEAWYYNSSSYKLVPAIVRYI